MVYLYLQSRSYRNVPETEERVSTLISPHPHPTHMSALRHSCRTQTHYTSPPHLFLSKVFGTVRCLALVKEVPLSGKSALNDGRQWNAAPATQRELNEALAAACGAPAVGGVDPEWYAAASASHTLLAPQKSNPFHVPNMRCADSGAVQEEDFVSPYGMPSEPKLLDVVCSPVAEDPPAHCLSLEFGCLITAGTRVRWCALTYETSTWVVDAANASRRRRLPPVPARARAGGGVPPQSVPFLLAYYSCLRVVHRGKLGEVILYIYKLLLPHIRFYFYLFSSLKVFLFCVKEKEEKEQKYSVSVLPRSSCGAPSACRLMPLRYAVPLLLFHISLFSSWLYRHSSVRLQVCSSYPFLELNGLLKPYGTNCDYGYHSYLAAHLPSIPSYTTDIVCVGGGLAFHFPPHSQALQHQHHNEHHRHHLLINNTLRHFDFGDHKPTNSSGDGALHVSSQSSFNSSYGLFSSGGHRGTSVSGEEQPSAVLSRDGGASLVMGVGASDPNGSGRWSVSGSRSEGEPEVLSGAASVSSHKSGRPSLGYRHNPYKLPVRNWALLWLTWGIHGIIIDTVKQPLRQEYPLSATLVPLTISYEKKRQINNNDKKKLNTTYYIMITIMMMMIIIIIMLSRFILSPRWNGAECPPPHSLLCMPHRFVRLFTAVGFILFYFSFLLPFFFFFVVSPPTSTATLWPPPDLVALSLENPISHLTEVYSGGCAFNVDGHNNTTNHRLSAFISFLLHAAPSPPHRYMYGSVLCISPPQGDGHTKPIQLSFPHNGAASPSDGRDIVPFSYGILFSISTLMYTHSSLHRALLPNEHINLIKRNSSLYAPDIYTSNSFSTNYLSIQPTLEDISIPPIFSNTASNQIL
eukprot:gene754-397_t